MRSKMMVCFGVLVIIWTHSIRSEPMKGSVPTEVFQELNLSMLEDLQKLVLTNTSYYKKDWD